MLANIYQSKNVYQDRRIDSKTPLRRGAIALRTENQYLRQQVIEKDSRIDELEAELERRWKIEVAPMASPTRNYDVGVSTIVVVDSVCCICTRSLALRSNGSIESPYGVGISGLRIV
mgnify:CR=1 FL=1